MSKQLTNTEKRDRLFGISKFPMWFRKIIVSNTHRECLNKSDKFIWKIPCEGGRWSTHSIKIINLTPNSNSIFQHYLNA